MAKAGQKIKKAHVLSYRTTFKPDIHDEEIFMADDEQAHLH